MKCVVYNLVSDKRSMGQNVTKLKLKFLMNRKKEEQPSVQGCSHELRVECATLIMDLSDYLHPQG